MEEAKDFNKYTSKVNFALITDFVLQNGQLTQYQKEISFADKMNPAN